MKGAATRVFYCYDLGLDSMTLIYDPDLHFQKTYLRNYEVCCIIYSN